MLLLLALVLCLPLLGGIAPTDHGTNMASSSSTVVIDPDVIDSEWNHHVAGYILIGSALLMLLSLRFHGLAFLRAVWPFLFIAAGLYLLAWSDKEIWPRGFLSWTWLIHHDAEARQHKIYGLLLLIMGVVEYLRWRGNLMSHWKAWAFPILATVGACLLLVHDHGGNSGLTPGWDNAEKEARIAQMARASGRSLVPVSFKAHPASEAATDVGTQHHDMAHMASSDVHDEMVSSESNSTPHPKGHSDHVMTPAMLQIKAQHLWFTLVGIAIALFKFIDDGSFWRKRFVPYLWPSGIFVLGSLLALYTETL